MDNKQDFNELKQRKKQADKLLLTCEIVMCVVSVVFMSAFILIASYVDMKTWLRIVLIVVGIIQFIPIWIFALKIEQVAGHYECKECQYKYVPTYKQILSSMHCGWTRYMKCPHCNKRTWNKKIID